VDSATVFLESWTPTRSDYRRGGDPTPDRIDRPAARGVSSARVHVGTLPAGGRSKVPVAALSDLSAEWTRMVGTRAADNRNATIWAAFALMDANSPGPVFSAVKRATLRTTTASALDQLAGQPVFVGPTPPAYFQFFGRSR